LKFDELVKPAPSTIKTWFLFGSPAELDIFTDNHASVEIRGFETFVKDKETRESYFNATVNVRDFPAEQSVGGVSGGGLWEAYLYEKEPGKIETVARLVGLAFWQYPMKDGHRTIRCHGVGTIATVAEKITIGRIGTD
jgi:hypothetical protein